MPGLLVRPTSDRLREALFNVIALRVNGAVFLDAYAGTGAVAIEALSRGAQHAILIERNTAALAVLRENLQTLGIEDRATVARGKAAGLLATYKCDIAFIDPPYELTGEYGSSLVALAESGCSLAIAQHLSKLALSERYGPFARKRVLKQGDNSLSFFERA